MEEIWKTVKNTFGLYQVSNLGNFRTSKTNAHHKLFPISPWSNKNGYLNVHFKSIAHGLDRYESAHKSVAKAFIPNPENKPQVNHIDGNKHNNNVTNLEWNTSKENNDHATNVLHCKRVYYKAGARHMQAKLTTKNVVWIYNHVKRHGPLTYDMKKMIAAKFGISTSTVVAVATGYRWPDQYAKWHTENN